jgi:hypothetical protein
MLRSSLSPIAVPLAVVALWLAPALAAAQVHDGAGIFSPAAVSDANASLGRMDQQFHKQLVIETIPNVPADQRAALQQQGKEAFFDHMKAARANALGVNGVYVLICMDPPFIDDAAGKETVRRGEFTDADLGRLRQAFRTALHDKQYDTGLRDAVDQVQRAYTANIPGAGGANTPVRSDGREAPAAGRPSAGGSVPSLPSSGGHMFGIGALVCLAIGALIIFSLVKAVFNRGGGGGNQGGGYGGGGGAGGFGGGAGNYPTGGPAYGPGYQNPPPSRGSGFGSGLLGGLLGGAVGGYAADRFEHRNDPTPSGGGDIGGGAAAGGGGGGSFDSGPSDAGQGFGDSGGGADFSSGGGGGDAGGGGDQGSF